MSKQEHGYGGKRPPNVKHKFDREVYYNTYSVKYDWIAFDHVRALKVALGKFNKGRKK